MAAAVWNKLTTRLSNWFGDEKRNGGVQLRPSRSLTALNQKNLRVTVRTSKSTENLLKIVTPSKKTGTLTKKSSTKDILKFSFKKKKDDEILQNNHQQNQIQNNLEESSTKTFPMSFSWHSHITDILHPHSSGDDMIAGPSTMPMPNNCIEVGPDGRIIDGTTLDATGANSGDSGTKPKRSKSITAINSEEYCVRSDSMSRSTHGNNHGFRTPQSLSGYKCKQTIDPRFWRYSREHSVTNTDAMFKRLEKIGEGSYATVLKGENRIDGSIVALKEIKLQPQEGLPFTAIREVSLLRGLKHANIVRLHQIVHQPHSLILVFEYVKTDLSKFMENYRNGLDPFRTKIFLFQLLRGLAFCHDRKILHRDLKPQNLLVAENNELKLADFGLARAKSVPCRTFSHDVVTLWYRPPDVLLGSTHYSTSLDLWGVGCIFAEMLTGIPLFPGINDAKDQLERIFSIRGLPIVEKWPEVVSLPNYKLFHFQAYSEIPWKRVHHIFSRLPEGGERLLNSFLQLNPIERISANAAMLHTYFSALPPEVHLLKPTESIFSVLPSSSSASFSR